MEKNKLNPVVLSLLILVGIAAVIIVLSLVTNSLLPEPLPGMNGHMGPGFPMMGTNFEEIREFFTQLLILKFGITSVNILLLIYLLNNYLGIYRDVKSHFSLGLVVMVSALLAHSIAANPLLQLVFGFRGEGGLGPFTVIPSFFTLVAALSLIYLSRK